MIANKIGLNATQIKDGMTVYFHSYYSEESGNYSEGREFTVKGDVFNSSNGYCCFLNGFSGYVVLTHLSLEFYPARYVKKTKAQKNYEEYLHNDGFYKFSDWLGIEKPRLDFDYWGNVRYISEKYKSVVGAFFKLKKDAKADYKQKLRSHLKSIKS